MTVTAHIRRTLAGTKPLHAAAGAGDLAVEKLRSGLAGLCSDLRDEPRAARDRAGRLRHDVGKLTHRTEEFARGRLDKAAGAYDDLAVRGERLLDRIRRRNVEHADATVRRSRATRDVARKGTEPGTKARRTAVAEAKKMRPPGKRAAQKIGD